MISSTERLASTPAISTPWRLMFTVTAFWEKTAPVLSVPKMRTGTWMSFRVSLRFPIQSESSLPPEAKGEGRTNKSLRHSACAAPILVLQILPVRSGDEKLQTEDHGRAG